MRHRPAADKYRFDRAGHVVPDYRRADAGPKKSSPARAAFKQARAERRANSTPAAAARAIHVAAQKASGLSDRAAQAIADFVISDADMRGDQ